MEDTCTSVLIVTLPSPSSSGADLALISSQKDSLYLQCPGLQIALLVQAARCILYFLILRPYETVWV